MLVGRTHHLARRDELIFAGAAQLLGLVGKEAQAPTWVLFVCGKAAGLFIAQEVKRQDGYATAEAYL
jgi:hypothetical protein